MKLFMKIIPYQLIVVTQCFFTSQRDFNLNKLSVILIPILNWNSIYLIPSGTVLEYHSTSIALLKTRSCIQFHKNVLFIAKCFQWKQLVQNSCSYPLIKNNDDHIFFDSQLIWSRMSLTTGSQWNCYSQWNCSWISFHINWSFKDQKLHPIP